MALWHSRRRNAPLRRFLPPVGRRSGWDVLCVRWLHQLCRRPQSRRQVEHLPSRQLLPIFEDSIQNVRPAVAGESRGMGVEWPPTPVIYPTLFRSCLLPNWRAPVEVSGGHRAQKEREAPYAVSNSVTGPEKPVGRNRTVASRIGMVKPARSAPRRRAARRASEWRRVLTH